MRTLAILGSFALTMVLTMTTQAQVAKDPDDERKEDLVTAYKILVNEGILDSFGHVTVRSALVAGAVDTVPLVPPQDKLLVDQGYNAITFYPDYYPKLALSTTAVSRAWAKNNADTVKPFMRAQAAAIVWLYDPANKDEALKLLIDETKADLSAAQQSYDVYLTKLHIFPTNGCVQPAGFEALINVLSKVNKAVQPGEAASQFMDTQYCPN